MSGICFQTAKRLYTMKERKVMSVEKVALGEAPKQAATQRISINRADSTKD